MHKEMRGDAQGKMRREMRGRSQEMRGRSQEMRGRSTDIIGDHRRCTHLIGHIIGEPLPRALLVIVGDIRLRLRLEERRGQKRS